MKKNGTILIGLTLFLSLMAACAKDRCTVVLLPDPDGATGSLTVANKGGSRTLNEANSATGVQTADAAPRPPETLTDEQIRETFGEALSSLPSPPIHIILYFRTGTTNLTNESRRFLSQVLPTIAERESTDVSVVGHTDRVGSRRDNFRLALDRAHLVRKMLLSLGIDGQHIEVTSHGEDNPLVKTDDEIAEPKNRRVEVVVR